MNWMMVYPDHLISRITLFQQFLFVPLPLIYMNSQTQVIMLLMIYSTYMNRKTELLAQSDNVY